MGEVVPSASVLAMPMAPRLFPVVDVGTQTAEEVLGKRDCENLFQNAMFDLMHKIQILQERLKLLWKLRMYRRLLPWQPAQTTLNFANRHNMQTVSLLGQRRCRETAT